MWPYLLWFFVFIGLLLIVALAVESLPNYSVSELNAAIGKLLERGFAPRFLLEASVSKAQTKKGHLWLTLSDGKASITSVVWASQIPKLNFLPKEGDGVLIVGKLNFWELRASLVVQALDIRPSISTVLRKFEVVKELLQKEGLLDQSRRQVLISYPRVIALLTSVPSSALADMLRTAKEKWPLTKLLIVPIPVQGEVANQIRTVLKDLIRAQKKIGIDAIVVARGGGSREDLMVFDNENLCRDLANFPIPVVTGIGHEDDLTVADLVADYRAATPTAAVAAALPSIEIELNLCAQKRGQFQDYLDWTRKNYKQRLLEKIKEWELKSPLISINNHKNILRQKYQLLEALSPERWLYRGFSIIRNSLGKPIRTVANISHRDTVSIQLSDGLVDAKVESISYKKVPK